MKHHWQRHPGGGRYCLCRTSDGRTVGTVTLQGGKWVACVRRGGVTTNTEHALMRRAKRDVERRAQQTIYLCIYYDVGVHYARR